MKYKSTRGSKLIKTAPEAIIKGIAEDKGLYVPENIPSLPLKVSEMLNMDYKEISFNIMSAFFPDYTEEEMRACINGAYDSKFEADEIVPITNAGGVNFLELYHGKTAAFKDMALSILPYFLTTAMKKENEDKKVCILTATSGDTGKAALEGFADVEGTEIVVFYPNQGVSEVQKRQMITQKGENTHVFAIKGNFDDAQTGVKQIFNDDAYAEKLAEKGVRLSSANSINIGRLVPQVAYYVYAYVTLVADGRIQDGDKINVVVPTGNFGNILASYYAMKMGIPVNKFICASNENKVLTDFINTGKYDIKRDFHLTNSPSMDILISSNLERLLYHLSGNNGDEIAALMADLENKKEYTVSDKIKEKLKVFYGGFTDVAATNETIGNMYNENGYLMDTHTSVAYKVYEDYLAETGDKTETIIASTASPYKFAESVAKSIDLEEEPNDFEYVKAINKETMINIPTGLKDLDKKEIKHTGVIEISEMADAIVKSL